MKKNQGSDSLFRLVQSLDANERGYVKKFLKRHSDKGNVNLDLVEALEKQSEYNETAIKKQFKSLAVVKVQAWDDIMDALRIYNKKDLQVAETFGIVTELEILRKKGMMNEGRKIKEQYIQKCYEREDFYSLVSLLPFNFNFFPESKKGKNQVELFDETMTEILSAIDKWKELNEYTRELGRLELLKQNPQRKNYLKEIKAFKENSSLFVKEPTVNIIKMRYFELHSSYYNAIGNKTQEIKWFEKTSKFLLDKMQKWTRFEIRFSHTNIALISAYIVNNQFEKAQMQINDFKIFTIKGELENVTNSTTLHYLQLTLFNRTSANPLLKKFVGENTLKSISHMQQSMPYFKTINSFKIDYLISLLLLEKHTEALRWILECDNDKTFRTGDVNYQLVLVIEIVLNYVLKDNETAEKNAKKYAKNKDFQLAHLFEALAISDKKKRDVALKDAMKNSEEKSSLLLEYFDVFDWIKTVLK